MSTLRPDLLTYSFVAAAVTACGFAVANEPATSTLVTVAAAATLLLALMPLRYFACVAAAGAALVPVAMLEAEARAIDLGSTPLAGQARWAVFLLAVVVARSALRGIRLRAAPGGKVAWGAAGAFLVVAVASSAIGDATHPGIWSDLVRDAAYAGVFAIGLVAARHAAETTSESQLFRAFAATALAAGAACIAYWADARGWFTMPVLGDVFAHAREASTYGDGRAAFPFVDDSPNLAAVAFVLLGAFAVPPLVESGAKRDRLLAFAVVATTACAVLATGSRTGLVTMAAAFAAYVVCSSAVRRRRAVAAIAIAGVFAFQGIQMLPQGRELSLDDDTFVSRTQIWNEATQRFLDKPLIGNGYRFSAQQNFTERASTYGTPTSRGASVHNEYLGRIVDAGVLGGLAFLAFGFGVVALARGLLRNPRTHAAGAGFAMAATGSAVSMTAGANLSSASVAVLTWLLIGLAAGLGASKVGAA